MRLYKSALYFTRSLVSPCAGPNIINEANLTPHGNSLVKLLDADNLRIDS